MSDATETKPDVKSLFGQLSDQELRVPIIGVTGKKGAGKTLLGLTLCPEDTVLIDIEDSSVTYNLPLKKRYSLYDEVQTKNSNNVPSPKECWEWFVGLIDSDELDCRVLFVDPVTDLQQGLVDWVRCNPEMFGKTANQYKSASGLLWADVKSHLKMVLGRLSRRVECFIFTAHMGSVWKGGAPVAGKSKAKGVDTFYELASLYLYLNRDADPKSGKVPAAPTASIVPPIGKSRLAHTVIGADGEVEIQPILPPTTKSFTWKRLRQYVAKPADYKKLKKDELAVSTELTEDEKLQLRAETANAELQAEELRKSKLDDAAAAAKRNAEAKSAAATSQAANEVKEASDTDPSSETAPFDLPREEIIPLIKEQFSKLEMGKDQCVKAIEKRGGEGKKLADLSDDQLEDLRKSLWNALTKRDIAKK